MGEALLAGIPGVPFDVEELHEIISSIPQFRGIVRCDSEASTLSTVRSQFYSDGKQCSIWLLATGEAIRIDDYTDVGLEAVLLLNNVYRKRGLPPMRIFTTHYSFDVDLFGISDLAALQQRIATTPFQAASKNEVRSNLSG
jgi:hypothetical protein